MSASIYPTCNDRHPTVRLLGDCLSVCPACDAIAVLEQVVTLIRSEQGCWQGARSTLEQIEEVISEHLESLPPSAEERVGEEQ